MPSSARIRKDALLVLKVRATACWPLYASAIRRKLLPDAEPRGLLPVTLVTLVTHFQGGGIFPKMEFENFLSL
jgi:hypothetical protein